MKQIKKIFARVLRKEQTRAEEKVWELLRNRRYLELKFRRQQVVEGFVIDFFCKEHKLGIEIDGSIHAKRKDYDEIRQGIIESEGITLIRVTNKEIERDKTILYKRIKQVIKKTSANRPPLPAPSEGEGVGVRA